ncbi:MAG: chemotaxis protein CheW [Pseudanabaenaceae cyanobacterium SKYGB_i_bin29]|nr:chemotaxis protein CheW [Pseudanabaenaceae cyanobacterium SKYG29]MDW8422492.1 chemotaxis protein CheW [Pseudanabaenaceae cyanobacterium SKYGB_i_bin29]
MLTTPFTPQRLATRSDNENLLRLIVFAVADYWLALPINAVIKVIPCPSIISNNDQGLGMVNVGNTVVSVVDLHFRFTAKGLANPRFLILSFSQRREVFGIPTDQVPGMVEVSLEQILPLPTAYRQVDALGLCSHMAILAQEKVTVYLLDVGSFTIDVTKQLPNG